MRRMRNHNLNLSYLKAQKGNLTKEVDELNVSIKT